jgi:hypothetical protein
LTPSQQMRTRKHVTEHRVPALRVEDCSFKSE